MTNDITAIVERARQSAATPAANAQSSADRQKLVHVAQEFESMMLVQVLKNMREAGKWSDEEEGDKSGLGADSLFEFADSELASQLAKVKGLGLSTQLIEAFDRMQQQAGAPVGPTGPGAGIQSVPGMPQMPAPPQMPQMPDVPAFVREAIERNRVQPTLGSPTVADAAPTIEGVGSPAVPTVDGRVTSEFGWRRDPFTGHSKFHRGVDLAAVYGQDVQAARGGRVVFSGEQRGYGNTVVLEHADGTRSRYAHLSARVVSVGESVGLGQPVGRAGHSGRATGTHVHFEVTAADGRPMSPSAWMNGTAGT